ncbi:hypothetical protein DFH09DRAFT_871222, partial [Mycena vulgaris]
QFWLLGSIFCDVIIAVTMIIILLQYRKETPWKNTDSLVTKLIYHTVQTGAITVIVSLLDLGLFFWEGYPPGIAQSELTLFSSFIIGKIYSNVMMASLNGR